MMYADILSETPFGLSRHTALYRYQSAEQSYCYVRHYGTGQASAESEDLADPAEERRPGKRQRVEDAPEAAQQVALAC
jgi:hypothetical protein